MTATIEVVNGTTATSAASKSRKSWQPLESKIVIRHRENNNVETLSVALNFDNY